MGRLKNDNTTKSYRGYTWNTDMELSVLLGHCSNYVCNHLRRGKTREQIIDYVLNDHQKTDYTKYNGYRGFTWTTNQDLSLKLNKCKSYVSDGLKHGKTYKELIDYVLDHNSIKEYRGIQWTTNVDLSLKLLKNPTYVSTLRTRGKTYEQIIDKVLDRTSLLKNKYEAKEYRGFKWTNDSDLSIQLGVYKGFVCIRRKKGMTYEEIIDKVLDEYNK